MAPHSDSAERSPAVHRAARARILLGALAALGAGHCAFPNYDVIQTPNGGSGGNETTGGALSGSAFGGVAGMGVGGIDTTGGGLGGAPGGSAGEGVAGVGGGGDGGHGGAPGDGGAAGDGNGPLYYGSEALLAYYRFDEGSGSVATDTSGHGNDGTLSSNPNQPAPIWTSGKLGGGLSMAGEGFVRVPYTSLWNTINTENAYTVAVWSYPQSTKVGFATLASRQYKTSGEEHFLLAWRDGRAAGVAGVYNCDALSAAPLNVWVHVAATYDGSTQRVYQDGIAVCVGNAPGFQSADDMTTGVIVGGNANDATPGITETFVGAIDELVIYNRALSVDEIVDLAAAKPPPPE